MRVCYGFNRQYSLYEEGDFARVAFFLYHIELYHYILYLSNIFQAMSQYIVFCTKDVYNKQHKYVNLHEYTFYFKNFSKIYILQQTSLFPLFRWSLWEIVAEGRAELLSCNRYISLCILIVTRFKFFYDPIYIRWFIDIRIILQKKFSFNKFIFPVHGKSLWFFPIWVPPKCTKATLHWRWLFDRIITISLL